MRHNIYEAGDKIYDGEGTGRCLCVGHGGKKKNGLGKTLWGGNISTET